MTPNLTEFSPEELEFAIVAIREAKAAAKYVLVEYADRGFDREGERFKFWTRQFDMAVLWETQLLNAKRIQNQREITTSN